MQGSRWGRQRQKQDTVLSSELQGLACHGFSYKAAMHEPRVCRDSQETPWWPSLSLTPERDSSARAGGATRSTRGSSGGLGG